MLRRIYLSHSLSNTPSIIGPHHQFFITNYLVTGYAAGFYSISLTIFFFFQEVAQRLTGNNNTLSIHDPQNGYKTSINLVCGVLDLIDLCRIYVDAFTGPYFIISSFFTFISQACPFIFLAT